MVPVWQAAHCHAVPCTDWARPCGCQGRQRQAWLQADFPPDKPLATAPGLGQDKVTSLRLLKAAEAEPVESWWSSRQVVRPPSPAGAPGAQGQLQALRPGSTQPQRHPSLCLGCPALQDPSEVSSGQVKGHHAGEGTDSKVNTRF